MTLRDLIPQVTGSIQLGMLDDANLEEYETTFRWKYEGEGIKSIGPFRAVADQHLQGIGAIVATLAEIPVSGKICLALNDRTIETSGSIQAVGAEAYYRMMEKIARLTDQAAVICTICTECTITITIQAECKTD